MNNTVELIGYYGGDIEHACSAWTSTSRELTDEKRARMPQLLAKLAQDEHHTPFEKSMLHFLVRCDLATHIQIIKHRVGFSVNTESARYKQLRNPTGYVPQDWPKELQERLERHFSQSVELYEYLMRYLIEDGFDRKRAKESARYVLPYSNQLTQDIGCNFRSFMHFLKLRRSEHAQREINDIAEKMLQLVKSIDGKPFQASLEAFGY